MLWILTSKIIHFNVTVFNSSLVLPAEWDKATCLVNWLPPHCCYYRVHSQLSQALLFIQWGPFFTFIMQWDCHKSFILWFKKKSMHCNKQKLSPFLCLLRVFCILLLVFHTLQTNMHFTMNMYSNVLSQLIMNIKTLPNIHW